MRRARWVSAVVLLVIVAAGRDAVAVSEVQMARPCSHPDATRAVARAGFLAVSRPATHSVAVYDIGAERFTLGALVGGPGSNASQFDQPSGVAIDAARRLLFVSDTNNHRIQVFRLPALDEPFAVTFAKAIGQHGTGLGQLDRPTALAVDKRGNLYVVDKGNARVQVFSADLQARRVFGVADELRDPLGIAVAPSGEEVYVADAGWRRIQHFGADGRSRPPLGRGRAGTEPAGTPGAFFYPADVAISNDGTVLVTDCADHVVQRFDASGALLPSWGQFGPDNGALNQPRAIAVDERDRVFVLDFGGLRAQMFTPTGTLLRAMNLTSQAKPTPPPLKKGD